MAEPHFKRGIVKLDSTRKILAHRSPIFPLQLRAGNIGKHFPKYFAIQFLAPFACERRALIVNVGAAPVPVQHIVKDGVLATNRGILGTDTELSLDDAVTLNQN